MKSFVFKKKIILLIISIIGIIISCVYTPSYNKAGHKPSSDVEKYSLFLFNTSCSFYTYFIEIVDSGTIVASTESSCVGGYEAIYNNKIERKDFYHGQVYKECFIDSAKIFIIKQEVEQIKDVPNPFLKSIYANTWVGVLMHDDKQIIFILSDHTDDDIGKLFKMFVDISPMPIELYNYGCWPAQIRIKDAQMY